MEAIFRSLCKDGKIIDLNLEEERMYAIQHDGEEIIKEYRLSSRVGPKMRMYAFYHKVILHLAMIGFTYSGEPGVDKVKADYLLRAEFAKDFILRKDGSYTPIMIDKKDMSRQRLYKFMQDCVFFIESHLQQRVPDADEYRVNKGGKYNFKKVEN